jgi:hypothetical protein
VVVVVDFWGGRAGVVPGLGERASVEAEALAHAEHQGQGALHPDATVAERRAQHRPPAGAEERAPGGEQAAAVVRPRGARQQLRHLLERHVRVLPFQLAGPRPHQEAARALLGGAEGGAAAGVRARPLPQRGHHRVPGVRAGPVEPHHHQLVPQPPHAAEAAGAPRDGLGRAAARPDGQPGPLRPRPVPAAAQPAAAGAVQGAHGAGRRAAPLPALPRRQHQPGGADLARPPPRRGGHGRAEQRRQGADERPGPVHDLAEARTGRLRRRRRRREQRRLRGLEPLHRQPAQGRAQGGARQPGPQLAEKTGGAPVGQPRLAGHRQGQAHRRRGHHQRRLRHADGGLRPQELRGDGAGGTDAGPGPPVRGRPERRLLHQQRQRDAESKRRQRQNGRNAKPGGRSRQTRRGQTRNRRREVGLLN